MFHGGPRIRFVLLGRVTSLSKICVRAAYVLGKRQKKDERYGEKQEEKETSVVRNHGGLLC